MCEAEPGYCCSPPVWDVELESCNSEYNNVNIESYVYTLQLLGTV